MKVAQLTQDDNESIADYLKRAFELSRKMVNEEIDVEMATLRGMRDQSERE
jgi:DNA-binding protein YbaB